MSDALTAGLLMPKLLLMLAGLVAVAAPATAAESPRDWLSRMSEAVEYLNYEGTLVHMHGEEADVMQIVHRVAGGKVSERITALNGPGREIIRNDDEVTCIFPDQQSVIVEPRKDHDRDQSPLRGRLPSPNRISSAHYQVAFHSVGSVAGREAQVVAIRPKDGYRYGYRLWLDQATAMPLKSQLLDERNTVVEQIQFADIQLRESISESRLQPSLIMDSFTWQRSSDVPAPADGALDSRWRATAMPPGFELMTAVRKTPPGSTEAMEQLVYTDGLASVSVFIESNVAESERTEGRSKMGAANAYTTTIGDDLVTAVGEVPARTVEMIATSVAPAGVNP